jgi:histidinol-phosphate/aromatic aminotransferase/cobyric acid decarboxylase-like protein
LLTAGSALTVGSTLAGYAALAAGSLARPPSLSGAHTRLSLNENAFGCSARVVEAIRRGLTDLARYTESEAHALTAQIAAKEGVQPEQIVLGEVLPALGLQLGPARLADSLHQQGLGAPHSLNRLALVAAAAALRDSAFIDDT